MLSNLKCTSCGESLADTDWVIKSYIDGSVIACSGCGIKQDTADYINNIRENEDRTS